jgi:Na+/H+-dicarboxylate symporter
MIIAMQRLKAMQQEGPLLAYWTVGWYVATTLLAIVISTILTDLIWADLMYTVGAESLDIDEATAADIADRPSYTISETVVNLFESFVPDNIVGALADSELLAVLVASIIIGVLLDPAGSVMKAVYEVETLVTVIIAWLIKVAPIGVFSLILSNLFKLDIAEMGENLGYLIAGSLANFFIHLFIVLPILYFAFLRKNPYTYWLRCSPAWITAWGSASSAATLPVTMKTLLKQGTPETIVKFTAPLGCLVNMDGTAIYFPICVTFLAETQGIEISVVNWVIVVLLSTLASIGTTPIPSSSLVLTIMIAESIDVPITGMFAAVVAIDWFLDRFRTALNVTGDLYAAAVVTKMTGITDEKDGADSFEEVRVDPNDSRV